MAAITPLHPVATATKAQHVDMARAALAKVYDKANHAAPADPEFWARVAELHLRTAELTD